MERKHDTCENGTLPDKDRNRYYSELMDQIDKAKRPIIDKISPDLYFEYYLFRLQLDGYYILWVGISKEKQEIYIRAYHRDSRRRLYVAMTMDGHLIPVEKTEKMAADTDIMRCPIYSEHACKGIIDDMHLDSAYELIRLPDELSELKKESDRMWAPYETLYWGDDVKDYITLKATDILELMLSDSFRDQSWFSSDRPAVLWIHNTDEIKGKDTLQTILADAIDFICENGGEVLIDEMGQSGEGYSVLRKRIRQYEKRHLVRINPYGNI